MKNKTIGDICIVFGVACYLCLLCFAIYGLMSNTDTKDYYIIQINNKHVDIYKNNTFLNKTTIDSVGYYINHYNK